MPILLMCKSYEYDDEVNHKQDGGYPVLVFKDTQHPQALADLEERHEDDWPDCTPLDTYYLDQGSDTLSLSGLDNTALARAISGILGKPMSAGDSHHRLPDLSAHQRTATPHRVGTRWGRHLLPRRGSRL